MKINHNISLLCLVGGALSASVVSCNTEECFDNRNALPLADLYTSSLTPERISLDSISLWGVGVPRDSMLLDAARSVQQIYFPFRIDDTVTRFVFRYDALRRVMPSLSNDTITFHYTPTSVFESQACGVFYRFDDVKIEHTGLFIDSIVCPEGLIDNTPASNLRIYFRTEE